MIGPMVPIACSNGPMPSLLSTEKWSCPMSERIFCADWFADNEQPVMAALQPLVDQPVHGLEIGSFEGRSACWFFDHILTNPASTLTCVDPYTGSADLSKQFDFAVALERFKHNTSEFGSRLTLVQLPSSVVLRQLAPNSYDFIFVDGSHEMWNALLDIVLAFQLTKPGGYVICDDYHWHPEYISRPAVAIDAFLQCYDPLITVLYKGH